MWKYVFLVLVYLITLEVWKCRNAEMWKYVFLVLVYLITLEVWKCGNVEICLHCLYLLTGSVDVWRNMSSSLTLEV